MSAATLLSPADAYQRLAATYDSVANPLISLEHRTVLSILPELSGRAVVDVGAGTGRWGRVCNAAGARTISVDFCAAMLQQAPAPVIVGDARRLPLPDQSADFVMCAFTLGYAPDCLSELARIVRPGGMVIASDVHPDAVKSGWKRSFRLGGEVIEIDNCGYEIKDLGCPPLRLVQLLQPRFDRPEREIFEAAGKLESFSALARIPAIFVAQWIRE
jgi:SAM-dependent methyltransferase